MLHDGEEIRAPLVLSSMDVKRTFLESVEERDLPGEFVQVGSDQGLEEFELRDRPERRAAAYTLQAANGAPATLTP